MIWMFLLAVVLGAVFFKLGVYSVVFGLVQLAGEGAVLRDRAVPAGLRRALDPAAAAGAAGAVGALSGGRGVYRCRGRRVPGMNSGEYHRDGVSMTTAGLPLPAPFRVTRECDVRSSDAMSDRSHDTLVYRLAQMLVKLNQGEQLDPQALAEEFGVNLRTIQRDLNERFAYLPLEKTDGRYHLDPAFLGKLSTQRHRAVCVARRGARIVSVAVG